MVGRGQDRRSDRLHLVGEAIATPVGGFWGGLAVSPPRTPPAPCRRHAALPPEFHIDRDPLIAPTAKQVDSVLPSWLHRFDGVALATFAQTVPGVATLRSSPRLQCANVVSPTMIHCDAVHWKRMATFVEGAAGHLFSLTHQGECVCRIEVEAVVGDSVAARLPSCSRATRRCRWRPTSPPHRVCWSLTTCART